MAQVIADRRDIDFVLHEQLEVENLSKHPLFADFDKETVDMIVSTARDLALRYIHPTLKIGDEIGCKYENNKVITPDEFKTAWQAMKEGDWFAIDRPREAGGQGMPCTVAAAARTYMIGANMGLMFPVHLIHGPGMLIELFGTEEQKALYLHNLYTGTWGCTMMLTEPDSGSDLSHLKTTATRNPDGTFNITGNKIFTSCGDQDLTENIIHLVLGRIKGAAPGAGGISLFLVPKFRINPDGSLGERNDVYCTGIENKMGHHSTPSCSMTLGGRGACIGTLLGPENTGLSSMFVMMNKFRHIVGIQGMSVASSAYLYALAHARNRIQGARLGDPEMTPIPIINHPDIRRMLMTMKMITEGTRSMLYYIANVEDKRDTAETPREREIYDNVLNFLIPVAKSYVTDRAVEICNLGMQIFGGYGYIKEYPTEQLVRDVKILTIYEGTNGVQSMDLMGRKLMIKGGRLFRDFLGEVRKSLESFKDVPDIRAFVQAMEAAVDKLEAVGEHLTRTVKGGDLENAYLYACPFMDVVGDIMVAWMLLWRAVVAKRKFATGEPIPDPDFYTGQIHTAETCMRTMLPVTSARMAVILDSCNAPMEITDEAFGGR
ncbi:MAG: acyl-CoA dehydrogenase [Desulfobacterales bacterium]|jgi:alkylation response protein AidB-like acyl-CoA dehydrogenase|nr:acyl-CoA dehydrogenase [Desulfobacterales bacterium]